MSVEAIEAPDTQAIENDSAIIVRQAGEMTVANNDDLTRAGEFLRGIKTVRCRIADTFDAPIKQAHAAHKAMLAAKKKLDTPLASAEGTVKLKVGQYQQEQERLRREEEERAREAARKAEEERRLAEAVELEEAGEAEEAEAVLAEPVVAPPVVVPKSVPKVEGVSTRKTWSAEVHDIMALACAVAEGKASRELIQPNLTALNAMARSLKDTMNVPGVQAVARTSVAAKGF